MYSVIEKRKIKNYNDNNGKKYNLFYYPLFYNCEGLVLKDHPIHKI